MANFELTDQERLRYSRHLFLSDFDEQAQLKLKNAKVLVLGAGGLGGAVLPYLVASGVGEVVVVDGDQVEVSNLPRQVLYGERDVGVAKALAAKAALEYKNGQCRVEGIVAYADEALLSKQVPKVDLVFDCTDNFTSRYRINAACVAFGKPLASGAVIRYEGQVAFFLSKKNAPCYACLYPDVNDEEDRTCTGQGVFAPLVGVVGSFQAMAGMNFLLGHANPLAGKLLLVDGKNMDFRTMVLRRDPQCSVCGDRP